MTTAELKELLGVLVEHHVTHFEDSRCKVDVLPVLHQAATAERPLDKPSDGEAPEEYKRRLQKEIDADLFGQS